MRRLIGHHSCLLILTTLEKHARAQHRQNNHKIRIYKKKTLRLISLKLNAKDFSLREGKEKEVHENLIPNFI